MDINKSHLQFPFHRNQLKLVKHSSSKTKSTYLVERINLDEEGVNPPEKLCTCLVNLFLPFAES